jgi:hypothetical protein
VVAALVQLVFRFRHSQGEVRQQIKWFTYAGAVMVITFVAQEVTNFPFPNFVFGLLIGLIPLAVGIAILKYRLYDIDLIINRTLVYVALTAVLALVYVGGVVGAGGLVRRMTGQEKNTLVVAASTLAVAGLFRPIRTRIQDFIDQRFYRSKYDAQQTIADFSVKMREQIDLDSLILRWRLWSAIPCSQRMFLFGSGRRGAAGVVGSKPQSPRGPGSISSSGGGRRG